MPWIHCEHQEVNTKPNPGNTILRSVCGLNSYGGQASPNQIEANSSGRSQVGKTGNSLNPHACTTAGQDERHKLCPSSRAPVLLPSAMVEQQHV